MKFTTLLLLLLASNILVAQQINGYAKVSSISGNVLTLSNVTESADSFEDGEEVIIMQMQDDVIGSNTSNNANFGRLANIQSAGLYEVATIQSHTESGGTPQTITLEGNLTNTYHTGTHSSVQIITFPTLGSPNHTMGNAAAKAWNGNTGGILAVKVEGTLTLTGNITANNKGFRPGSVNLGSSTSCQGGVHFAIATNNNVADKGEGIYKNTIASYQAGQAPVASGGGGGASHNAGGGGGSNYSSGGTGGRGWGNCDPTAGGYGGVDLSSVIAANRFFMGGAGGSGEGNNNQATAGGKGGGIIIIKANKIATAGSCGSVKITANGQSMTTGSNNDGSGGGGAGGTVFIETDEWDIAAGCTLEIETKGGEGGSVTHPNAHGAGGGGGQGALFYSSVAPTENVTTDTSPGQGGKNCTTCDRAASGSGENGEGIVIHTAPSPLPIELIEFDATLQSNEEVLLTWSTATETNNDFFTIERSKDAKDWHAIATINGAGTTSTINHYRTEDEQPLQGTTYYRLKQTDFDGQYTYSSIRTVQYKPQHSTLSAYPNPTTNYIIIEGNNLQNNDIQIFNAFGQPVTHLVQLQQGSSIIEANLSNLPNGLYHLKAGQNVVKIYKQ